MCTFLTEDVRHVFNDISYFFYIKRFSSVYKFARRRNICVIGTQVGCCFS